MTERMFVMTVKEKNREFKIRWVEGKTFLNLIWSIMMLFYLMDLSYYGSLSVVRVIRGQVNQFLADNPDLKSNFYFRSWLTWCDRAETEKW